MTNRFAQNVMHFARILRESGLLGGSKVVPPVGVSVDTHGQGQPDTHIPLWLIVTGAVGLATILFVLTRH